MTRVVRRGVTRVGAVAAAVVLVNVLIVVTRRRDAVYRSESVVAVLVVRSRTSPLVAARDAVTGQKESTARRAIEEG